MSNEQGVLSPQTVPWRTLSLVMRIETRYPERLVGTAFSAALLIFVYCVLWSSMYCDGLGMRCEAGMDARTYSILSVLLLCTRGAARDSVRSRIREGTLLFWFVRPMPPQRYLALRGAGATAYGLMWLLPGLSLTVASGLAAAPHSAQTAAAALVSLLIGQVVAYHLALIIELICFWTLVNYGVTRTWYTVQDLLSGALIPLWLLPLSAGKMMALLPFPAVVHIPISIYLAPAMAAEHWRGLLVQMFWAGVLTLVTRWLWRGASRRVVTDGG